MLLTNATTYINIPLLRDFVSIIPEPDFTVWCGNVVSARYMSGPYSWCFYGEGSAILLKRPYINYIMYNNKWRKWSVEHDVVDGPDYWKMYKHNTTDTAIGCIIDDLLLWDGGSYCLKWMEVDDSYVITQALDHTEFWQDWGQEKMDAVSPEVWPSLISIDCRGKCPCGSCENLREVHDAITEYYIENDWNTDMRYVQEYIGSEHTPMVMQSYDKPDCCIDDVQKIPYDDYHKWLEDNSDIPNLHVDENGDLVPGDGNGKQKNLRPYDQWGQVIPEGMTYAEYFNIPFWNHRCWYRRPWAGDNFCGCCKPEQLVYPAGSPSHEYDNGDPCGCGSDNANYRPGSSSGQGSSSGDKDCPCHEWNVI